jgi:recombination protein RecR
MGGDHGPAEVVPGALDHARENPQDRVILVGDEATIRNLAGELPPNVSIVHASEVVDMDEHEPALALREKKDSSILVATELVKRGQADAIVTAGHTGAGMAAAVLKLGRLPGVGPKSAQRIAFHLLQADEPDVRRLAEVLVEVKARVKFCTICFNVSEDDQCRICRDPRRDQTVLCVVEEYKDVVAIERTREFKGRYHVLGGAISPIDGVGPEQLRVRELMMRLADGTVTELILATDPNLEGEATATYLTRMLKDLDLTVTRLASGLPVGGDLEYADEVTLGRALAGRRSAR